MSEGLKIIRLEAENVLKLKAVAINPEGSVIQITGPNGSGKTSVLNAIYMALAGKRAIDSQPVREGSESARIMLDLGAIIVTRTFTADGTTKLEVATDDGAKFPSPQKMLDELVSTLTFDPLSFLRADPKAQLNTLKALVKLDIDIDALDFENRRDFDVRTGVNRTVKELEAQLKALPKVVVPAEPANISTLLTELEQSVEANRAIDVEARRRSDHVRHLAYEEDQREKLLDQLATLEMKIAAMRTERDEWPAEGVLVEVSDLRTKIDDATEARRVYDAAQWAHVDRTEVEMKLDSALIQADDLTAQMETRTLVRTTAIAAATMPVDGLGFGDGEVMYGGHPFSQASGAEQLRVSVAIAMTGNPKLRILRIKDGSLLDTTSMQMLTEMAELRDFQVWIECVDESGKVGIFMTDGEVAAVNV